MMTFMFSARVIFENFACDRFAIQTIYQCNVSKDDLEVIQ